MSEDVIKIILGKLDRIETKQDAQAAQLARIAERLAAIETKQAAQDKINEKVCSLEEVKDKGAGAKSIVAWLVATGLSVAALVVEYLKR